MVKKFHPRNLHKGSYDLKLLAKKHPSLSKHIFKNEYQNLTINFSNPTAVKELNAALLKNFYKLSYWDIPTGYLCPPIPGRADYIHYAADLLGFPNNNKKINALDIGTGANMIYPIIGVSSYSWNFVASDVDKEAISSAEKIIASNKRLSGLVDLRLQTNKRKILDGIIKPEEHFDIVICNPPFHSSRKEAEAANARKRHNLKLKGGKKLNFGGQHNELWCEGGEVEFIKQMIRESNDYRNQCHWFTSLVSKKESLKPLLNLLKKQNPTEIKTILMTQGQKVSRFIAWTHAN